MASVAGTDGFSASWIMTDSVSPALMLFRTVIVTASVPPPLSPGRTVPPLAASVESWTV